jgi:hypothetical protein
MSEAVTSVVTCSTEQCMVEMVHDHTAAGEATVVPMAAVLRCGKQMEKLPHTTFLDSLSPKTLSLEEAVVSHTHAECLCRAKLVLEKVFAWRNEDRGGARRLARL